MQAIQVRVYHLRAALLHSSAFPELNLHVEKGLFQSQSFSVTTLSPFLDADFWEKIFCLYNRYL